MDYLALAVTPILGAVIGYFTNWLAIKMLFRPHKEKRIFGIKIPFTPGLIPKERARLTAKIAETVSAHVLTPEVLAKELASAGIWERLLNSQALPDITIGDLLDKIGIEDISKTAPQEEESEDTGTDTGTDTEPEKEALDFVPKAVAYARQWMTDNPWLDERLMILVRKIIDDNFSRVIGIFIDHKKIYGNIKEGLFTYLSDGENRQMIQSAVFGYLGNIRIRELAERLLNDERTKAAMDENGNLIKRALEQAAAYVAKNIRVREMIEEKINAFAMEEAEALILSVVNRELQAITVLGGVLGLVIGLISLLPRLFIS